MFTTRLRLILIVLLTALAAWNAASARRSGTVLLLGGAAFLAWGYFRYGTVWLAWREVRRGNMRRAGGLLREVRFPSALTRAQRAYYGWALGFLSLSGRDYRNARRLLDRVDAGRLRTSNDRSILDCHRAQAAAGAGDPAAARAELERARAQPHKPGVDLLIGSIDDDLRRASSG
jgi:hypothetical protein